MLEDKVIIVTGAHRGLGQAYAIEAARLGARVVAGDILDCGDTVRQIEADGGKAIGVELDVTKMGTVSAMAESAIDAFGDINVLVNNAAVRWSYGRPLRPLDEGEWDRCMNVNVKGIWNCCGSGTAYAKFGRRSSSTSPRWPRLTACPSYYITQRQKPP